jgi:Skp family chaperone for outer membrane proteins
MRKLIACAIALTNMTFAAYAADADGKIKTVDAEKMIIVLDDGKTYRLPAEMDMSVVVEGAEVIIAYDAKDGVNQITDMLIQ